MTSYLKYFPKKFVRIASCWSLYRNITQREFCLHRHINYNVRYINQKKIDPRSHVLLFSSILSWLGLTSEDEETPEDKLINTIKRSILCIQREQYDKAEQMLHLALRMAQDLQSKDGVMYVYDVMANLAMERDQFKKAEKLFAEVIKRLLAAGYTEDSLKILHISSKLANMAQLQGHFDKAKLGFNWVLEKVEEWLRRVPDDVDAQELWGLTKNWFGEMLMKQGKYKEAKKNFEDALDCRIKIHGAFNDECVSILNSLSVACINMEKINEAKEFLLRALDLVKKIKDTTQEGILLANLGMIYLREGLQAQAKDSCLRALKMGTKEKDDDLVQQAEHCLNEVKNAMK
uniref:MalT-like TPR region domain-containing protein n=1 Tax=Glossina brevipalpis TaxID=37001 RepID=A0A1A9WWC8_9MUSC